LAKAATMYYFIIPFTVTINGDLTEEGTAGVISRLLDYRSNAIKSTAVSFYQEKYNTGRSITVKTDGTLMSHSEDVYTLLRPGLTIEIIEKGSGLTY
jgi:hypothetical protein